jgi:hypothetical protein
MHSINIENLIDKYITLLNYVLKFLLNNSFNTKGNNEINLLTVISILTQGNVQLRWPTYVETCYLNKHHNLMITTQTKCTQIY